MDYWYGQSLERLGDSNMAVPLTEAAKVIGGGGGAIVIGATVAAPIEVYTIQRRL